MVFCTIFTASDGQLQCCCDFLNNQADKNMDVRDMSYFQTGSFEAVIDKGTLLTYLFDLITFCQGFILVEFFCGIWLFLLAVFVNGMLLFVCLSSLCFVWSCRDSRLALGKLLYGYFNAFSPQFESIWLEKNISAQCGDNSRQNAVKMLEEVWR